MGKFLHRGSVERVLHCGSMDNYAYSLLGIEHHNDSYVVEMWGSSYTVEMRKGSYTVEAWTIVLIRCWVSSTIMFHMSWKRGEFLHHGSVGRVLHLGSMDNYTDPLLGIEHRNDSYAMEAWGSSYIVEVWKGSCIILEIAFKRVG